MIDVAWVFPRHLNTYGDRGNVLALEYRCRARGIALRVQEVAPREPLPPADVVFIGGGQDRFQAKVAEAVVALRDRLAGAIEDGAVVLAVCAGYQFLGRYYELPDGRRLGGLGILDVATTAGGPDRLVGKVVIEPDPTTGLAGRIVGFENHSGRTVFGSDPDLRPLGRVLRGRGNNGTDGLEGACKGNVFGSYLHGPLLPNNPELCDLIIRRALRRRGHDEPLAPLDDTAERTAAAAFEVVG
jgi:CobQ-like glutamine amidotransferase family enzyme